jgi:hypothetical protein
MFQRAMIHKDKAYRNFVCQEGGGTLREAHHEDVEDTMQVTYLKDPFGTEIEENQDYQFIATYQRPKTPQTKGSKREELKKLMMGDRSTNSPVTKLLLSNLGLESRAVSVTSTKLPDLPQPTTAQEIRDMQKTSQPKWVETWDPVEENFLRITKKLHRAHDSIKDLDDLEKEPLLVPLTMKEVEKSCTLLKAKPKRIVNWTMNSGIIVDLQDK